MAKKRKKTNSLNIAGIRVPRSLVQAAIRAAQTPLGKVILAEALVQAAAMLVARHPTAAAAAAGAGTATAAKDLATGAREAAVKFLHGTADLLRGSVGGTDGRKADGKKDTPPAEALNRHEAGNRAHKTGNGAGSLLEALDPEIVRDALLGELSRRKKGKKSKTAKRG